ncbi:MAG TPA: hypothetical protein VK887_15765 [Pseudonocardiaceae bacterium]|nr:hypothetical protein [Pseudonocardiaceae bacterium]
MDQAQIVLMPALGTAELRSPAVVAAIASTMAKVTVMVRPLSTNAAKEPPRVPRWSA